MLEIWGFLRRLVGAYLRQNSTSEGHFYFASNRICCHAANLEPCCEFEAYTLNPESHSDYQIVKPLVLSITVTTPHVVTG